MKLGAFFLALQQTSVEAKSAKPWRVFHAEKQNSKRTTLTAADNNRILRQQKAAYEKDTSEDKIVILDWWGGTPTRKRITKHECPETACYVTNDRSYEKQAEGILIDNTRYIQHHGEDHPDLENRNQDQYWIFWAREAASKGVNSGGRIMQGAWDSGFNMTTSYRRDSDIPRPFGSKNEAIRNARYKNGELIEDDETHINNIMKYKNAPNTKYAAWIVSNCEATAGAAQRFSFGERLVDAGLKLDGYGECWNNTIIESPWHGDSGEPGLISKYKFYLAFENSYHCNDYVSEKFWRNSLGQGAVPIVYGPHPDDVKEMAPEHSYIHAEDFATPADLVEYLDYLDNNDTAYLEYHAWRNEIPTFDAPMMGSTERMLCGACEEIALRKSQGFPKRMIDSVASWWWMNQHDDMCVQGFEVPEWLNEIPVVSMEDVYDEKDEGNTFLTSSESDYSDDFSLLATFHEKPAHHKRRRRR